MSMLENRLAEIRHSVRELDAAELHHAMRDGMLLIDIREAEEVAAGSPVGALRIVRSFLEVRLPQQVPAAAAPLCLMCASGTRSLLAASALQALGYREVSSLKGGFASWQQAGFDSEKPVQLTPLERGRYARHLSIPEVGEAGQLKLRSSKVLLIGAGGLGSPAALYLAAAGVGTIGLVDHDVVDSSNLQRQILHTEARVGEKKVDSAKQALLALNSTVTVDLHEEMLSADNVERILSGYQIVLDGTDNFSARYLINDACVKLGIPNVHAAVFRFEGYVTVYSPRQHDGPCYRCDYPNPPPPELAPSCADAGVLGVLPGVIGLLQAVEALKLLLGIGEPLLGRVLSYDALKAEFAEYHSGRNPDCPVCSKAPSEIHFEDLAQVCASPAVAP